MTRVEHKIECLREAAARSPEYAEIVPFFIALFHYLGEMGTKTGIGFPGALEKRAEKLANGFSLLSSEEISVDPVTCTVFLDGVIEVLKSVGREGGGDLAAIQDALATGKLDVATIFKAILQRQRGIISEAAESVGAPASLLEFVCETPLKVALEQLASQVPPEEFAEWGGNTCPVCGSRAGMSELSGEEGKRFLSCSACQCRWPYRRLQCPFCGNDQAEQLSYFTAGDGPVRVDTCKACSRYIKTRDSRMGHGDVPLDIDDVLTIHLDLLASREGFERGK
jgi:FdhE protein